MFLLFNTLAPGQPTSFRFISTSATSLYVEWEPPSISNGIIRYYQIEHYLSSTNEVTEVIAEAFPRRFNITGLRTGVEYNVKVAAFTVELGPFSNPITAFTTYGKCCFDSRRKVNFLLYWAMCVVVDF